MLNLPLTPAVLRSGFLRRTNLSSSRRAHLSDVSAQVKNEAALKGAAVTGTGTSSNVKKFARHGTGDSIIILDVGGREFKTLRSTIESNRVLSNLVARAEANAELTLGGKAIFIDRDPTHFGLILQHLRNTADGLSYNTVGRYVPGKRASKMSDTTVRLPADRDKLRDVYMESTFYDIEEMRHSACGQSVLAWFFTNIGGKNSNPFDEAAKFLSHLKRGLLAAVGLVGVSNTGTILDRLPDGAKAFIIREEKLLEEVTKSTEESKRAKKKDDA